MELKQYWQIVWKRVWIPILLVAVAGGASYLTWQASAITYSTRMRFAIRVKAEPVLDEFTYDRYYEWLSSEYMADDMTAIVSSELFAQDVNQQLAEMGYSVRIPPGSIGGISFGEKLHRVLEVNVTWGNPEELLHIAEAVGQAMVEDGSKYLETPGSPGTLIIMIDSPSAPVPNPPSLTERLNIPIRMILALGAGIALTFLLDYLDQSVRNKAELEAMGISVLAEVPEQKRFG